MFLHKLKPDIGSRHRKTRVARGSGAGGGTTAGRGTKGQQSRAGKGHRYGFEGGQTPLIRRQPKLGGFTSPNKIIYQALNIDALDRLPEGTYDIDGLKAARVVSGKQPVKLLGRGTVGKKLAISVHASSKSAKLAIEKAGGSVTILK